MTRGPSGEAEAGGEGAEYARFFLSVAAPHRVATRWTYAATPRRCLGDA
ncbi:MAG: hypothetical protein JW751_16280 [Polyangiaceae bacterium]|nr:hypothetical protein [Polyangiaceae bacterium]